MVVIEGARAINFPFSTLNKMTVVIFSLVRCIDN